MKHNIAKIIGWLLFVLAAGFFCLQLGYLFAHARYEAAYVDNRLFYIINMLCVICAGAAILLLVKITRKWVYIGLVIVVAFVAVQGILLTKSNQRIKNVTSISPDFKHVLSIKEKNGEAVYFRTYYKILARPKEKLPGVVNGDYDVKWLENDVAVVTYVASDHKVQQFVGTYGDRGSGGAYYYVGAEINGQWKNKNAAITSDKEGITVTWHGKAEMFEWEQVKQYGTLAVVLQKNNQAVWTIALNKNFQTHSNEAKPPTGSITLYPAAGGQTPVTLKR